MNRNNRPHQYVASKDSTLVYGDAVEWEELPSLAGSLAQRLLNPGPHRPQAKTGTGDAPPVLGAAWDSTRPATLDALPPQSEPFRETLQGLVTREVNEPEVFRHFFGPDAKA